MPLSDDQKAMLRLLAREQSYEDIGALMGLSVDEVVARAEGAVAQLESEGIPAPALPPAPGGAAAAPPPPTAPTPAAPAAKEPPAPEPQRPEPKAAPTPTPPPAAPRKPRDKNMLVAIGSGAVGVVVIVVLAVLLISGSDGDSSDTTAARTTVSDQGLKPTMAVLKPVGGGEGSGQAVFGNLEEQLVLAIEAKGLEPTEKGTIYAICIAAGPNRILPIASTGVGAKGTIKASVQLPAELLLYLANETYSEIVITRADTARLAAEIKKQAKEPAYTGTPVLSGEITGSLIGNRDLLKRVQEQKEAE